MLFTYLPEIDNVTQKYVFMVHYNSRLARLLLPRGYSAITLFGHVFVKASESETKRETITHEEIHVEQWKELMFFTFFVLNVPIIGYTGISYTMWTIVISLLAFYIWYIVEYLVRLVITRNHNKAYYGICFEEEAYDNESSEDYTSERGWFSFLNYLLD